MADVIYLHITSKEQLQNKLYSDYMKNLRDEINMKQKILSDKNWASSGSPYHAECRFKMQSELDEIKNHLSKISH